MVVEFDAGHFHEFTKRQFEAIIFLATTLRIRRGLVRGVYRDVAPHSTTFNSVSIDGADQIHHGSATTVLR